MSFLKTTTVAVALTAGLLLSAVAQHIQSCFLPLRQKARMRRPLRKLNCTFLRISRLSFPVQN
jgi:hypothetical protein